MDLSENIFRRKSKEKREENMKELLSYLQEHIGETITITLSVLGGIFALLQWKKSNDYKRAELVNGLINTIRDNKTNSVVIDMIEWAELVYDSKFKTKNTRGIEGCSSSEQMTIMVDGVLAHFNYICYLKRLHIFKRKDMAVFDYEIKRLFDNDQVCNYLYSLFLWSTSLGVMCSFKHLIRFGLRKRYLHISFLSEQSKNYICWLVHRKTRLLKRILKVL